MASSETTPCGCWTSWRSARLTACGLLLALAGAAAAAPPAPCTEGAQGYTDPLAREGLSFLTCPAADDYPVTIIVTDGALSWPVFLMPAGAVSAEQSLLDQAGQIAEGLFYFNPDRDRVDWPADGGDLAVMSVSTSDPVTLAPSQRWLLLDPATGTLLAVADDPEDLAKD